MAVKNAKRSRWVIERLAPQAGERVLEVGFGPGVDVARVLSAVSETGHVAGVDISSTMVNAATSRNRSAVSRGRADLRQGTIAELPFPSESFDAALSVNCAQFWPD